MPYATKKLPNGKIAIIKKTTGKVVGHSDSESMAMKAMRARYAHEGGGSESKAHEKMESKSKEKSEGKDDEEDDDEEETKKKDND